LKWLDSTYDGTVRISDDQVIALAVSKQAERKDQSDLCRSAVKIIADDRNSEMLRSWLAGGDDSGWMNWDAEDKFTNALSYFGIVDKTANIDVDVLWSFMEDKKLENPLKEDEVQNHYNNIVSHLAGKGNTAQPDYDNPVGLSNMGNTCYLNCLLQYFYTIKPLRDMILHFDEFRIDMSDPQYRAKKVGSKILAPASIRKSQACKFTIAILPIVY
jgi:ubiquitin carboxyl-terminal hydrolase 25